MSLVRCMVPIVVGWERPAVEGPPLELALRSRGVELRDVNDFDDPESRDLPALLRRRRVRRPGRLRERPGRCDPVQDEPGAYPACRQRR